MSTKKSLIADKLYRDLHSQSPPSASGTTRSSSGSASRKGKGLPPRLLICYLCGQQFGTASLEIHQPQCYVKQLLRWERGDPTTRGKRPIPPEEHKAKFGERPVGGGAGATSRDLDAYNDQMFEDYNKNALVPCENCGRTFLPDRLQVHLKSCKPGNAARKPPQRATSAGVSRSSASPNSKRPPPPPREEEAPLYESPTFIRGQTDTTTASMSLQSEQQQQHHQSPGVRPPPPPRHQDHDEYDVEEEPNAPASSSSPPSSLQSKLEARRAARNQLKGEVNTSSTETKPSSILQAESELSNSASVRAIEDRDPPELQGTLRQQKQQSSSPLARPKTATTTSVRKSTSPSPSSKPRMTLAERAAADFERCKYCNRTFAPDRLTKHEDVCLDKYKTSIVASNNTNNNNSARPVPKRTTTPIRTLGTKSNASPPTRGGGGGMTTGGAMQHQSLPAALFCEECGTKLQSAAKFCSQCGTKCN